MTADMNPGMEHGEDPRTPKELALATIAALQRQVREWEAEEHKAKAAQTPEPDHRHYRWTIYVRYAGSSEVYEYLILRSPKGGYFTTGTGTEKNFKTWKELVGWLHGKRVAWHSVMRPLTAETGAPPAMTMWGVR